MVGRPFWDVLQTPGLRQSAEASTGALLAGSQHDYNRIEDISSLAEMDARFDWQGNQTLEEVGEGEKGGGVEKGRGEDGKK